MSEGWDLPFGSTIHSRDSGGNQRNLTLSPACHLFRSWVSGLLISGPSFALYVSKDNTYSIGLFFKLFFIFRESGREGERVGEKHQCVVASHTPPTGDLACNPGMYPDRESNRKPFSSKAGAQSTEPRQPGLHRAILRVK